MTNVLSADALSKVRAVQNSNLPESAVIQQLTVTNGASGYQEAWTTRASVNARIGEPRGEVEKNVASAIRAGKVFVITLPFGTAIEDSDQIQISGVNYRVHWTNEGQSNATALRVIVSEV